MSKLLTERVFGPLASDAAALLTSAVDTVVDRIKRSPPRPQSGGMPLPMDFFGDSMEAAYTTGASGGDDGFPTTVTASTAAPGVPQVLVGGGAASRRQTRVSVPRPLVSKLSGVPGWREALMCAMDSILRSLRGDLTAANVKRVLKSKKLLK